MLRDLRKILHFKLKIKLQVLRKTSQRKRVFYRKMYLFTTQVKIFIQIIYSDIYSKVHIYWDIDTIFINLPLYTPKTDLIKCRLSALIWGYLNPNQVNGVGIATHFIRGFLFLGNQKYLDNWLSAVPWRGVCSSLIISFII